MPEWPLDKPVDKQNNNIIQKLHNIPKHIKTWYWNASHIICQFEMSAWPSEQRCMGWTQWAADEDRHLVPSLELTQEETGFVKNWLLQVVTHIITSRRLWEAWDLAMVCLSLFVTARSTRWFHDSFRARFPTQLQHFAWHFEWELGSCVWVVNFSLYATFAYFCIVLPYFAWPGPARGELAPPQRVAALPWPGLRFRHDMWVSHHLNNFNIYISSYFQLFSSYFRWFMFFTSFQGFKFRLINFHKMQSMQCTTPK